MKCLTAIVITALLAVFLSTASAAPGEPAGGVTVTVVPLSGAVVDPMRDRGDEDSVYYEYGFEDGWQDWAHADLTDPGNMWHRTEEHAREGLSWWCADPDLGGYDNHWLQYLISPPLDLRDRENIALTFSVRWDVEDPEPNPPGDQFPQYDAWDGCNVWVSTDGGDSWEVINPTRPEYNYESLFSFGYEWGMGPGIPGWCGSSNGWQNAEVDLSDYAGEADVRIRWAFCSDPAWATIDDESAIGYLVDDLQVTADEEVIWENDASEQGDMTFDRGPAAGDFWEISDEDAHSGEFSAHCPIRPVLNDALITPGLEIPEAPWYTYFDFWIRADGQNFDPNGDNSLDDYYVVELSTDGTRWEKLFHDYGRNRDWWDWHYYGPDTTYNDVPEWKRKLNLTGFAGETVWIRWRVSTDSVMGENEGSGFWIDDFRLNITNRPENDVGVSRLMIPYPNALGFNTRCAVEVRNFGLARQEQVRKFYQINNLRAAPIVPWDALDADSMRVYNFIPASPGFADSVTYRAWTVIANEDGVPENDTAVVAGVTVYPEGIWNLGYDARTYNFRYAIARGSGPMVYFTPSANGIGGAFDLKALRVRWDGSQQGDVQTRLHIYGDNQGNPGQELYNSMVTVTQADLLPRVHVIDLSGVDDLQNIQRSFWVWFEITRDDQYPQIIGDAQQVGQGHYFTYNGQRKTAMNADLQIHSVLMPAGGGGLDLVAGREELDFGAVEPGRAGEQRVLMFNGGDEPVTIEAVRTSDNAYRAFPGLDPPAILRTGDAMLVTVVFRPQEERNHFAELTFTTDDPTPPVVRLRGYGGLSVDDESVTPAEFSLGEAYPNPFNSSAVIPFSLPAAGDVSLILTDINGRQVAELANGVFSAGRHLISVNGEALPTGIYLVRLSAAGRTTTRKVALVK